MRIAQVSPLFEAVPPPMYGGTERVVANLTEELVAQGHDVTLFATADSRTSARLVGCAPGSLRLAGVPDPVAHHVAMLESVRREASGFDVVHFHLDYLHLPMAETLPAATVTTQHGRLDLPDLVPVFEAYRHAPMVSISNDQRTPVPWLNWVGTVHHGLPTDAFHFTERAEGSYLAFVGRITPEKGVEEAIEIAYRAGVPIRIAAKIEPRPHSLALDRAYIDEIREHFDSPLVQYVGEVGDAEKEELLGNALALVFPIKWDEPFGLAMIEAMASGTPVIAYRRGSVPEVVADGETGFVVTDTDEAASAVRRASRLDRRHIRKVFERRFSAERMARDYLAIYDRLIAARQAPSGLAAVSIPGVATPPMVAGDPLAGDPLAGTEIGP